MAGLWYLSFADPSFLGACVVQADDIEGAIREAWRLGINPGGQVLGMDITGQHCPFPIRELLTLEQLEAVGPVEWVRTPDL